MDRNAIDNALHEIGQMIRVSLSASDGLMGSDTSPGFSSCHDAELLLFSIFDIEKRVAELKAAL
jgi:hypothetical protein